MDRAHGLTVADPARAGDGTVRQDVLPVVAPGIDSSVSNGPPTTPSAGTAPPAGGTTLPEVGDRFLGFHLLEELGRGAFGRVFLARQGDLAGRTVALKVGVGLFPESQALAQLQHTNIVPIYSLHQSGAVQAVCMPFFGRTTLARVLQGIRGQAVFPSSGHALLTTLQAGASGTVPDRLAPAPSPAPSDADPTPCALLRRLSYPDAVVWVGAQLAAGLAHAHGRGILHRDLKPANILLTDEGVPMLLDFNLAADTKAHAPDRLAGVGGTLPYMAPEQLAGFGGKGAVPDPRSDLYSLGVLLFELFTGRRPFPDDPRGGSVRDLAGRMAAARRAGPPSVRALNPEVPHAMAAVVQKCLAPHPAFRYPSAQALREDLERHLAHQSLRHVRETSWREWAGKWARRHPRLASSTSVAVVAAVLIAAVAASAFYARERNRSFEADARYRAHAAEVRALQTFLDDRNRSLPQLDEGLARCREALDRYGVPDDRGDDGWERAVHVRYLPEGDRAALRGDVGELFYLMARVAYRQAVSSSDPAVRSEYATRAERWNELAGAYAGDRLPLSILVQRADVARLQGAVDAERAARERAAATSPGAARDHYLMGSWYAQLGRHRDALKLLRKATLLDPEHFPAWFVRGTSHLALEQNEMAALCFGSCVALNKEHAPAWLNRGLAYSRLRFFEQACDDYDRALRLDPGLAEARMQRATAREALGDLKAAVADLTEALGHGSAPTRIYFVRSHLKERLGNKEGAAADLAEGLKLTPADEMSWVARSEHRLDDPKAALDDVDQALRLNPTSAFALQLKAHILAERLGRGAEAVPVLDRAVELYPDYVPARAGRGVLLARAGDRAGAVKDAEEALLRDTKGPNLYQVACIYALTSRQEPTDRVKAVELLRAALKTRFGLDLVDTDPDFDPIRKDPAFQKVVADAKRKAAPP